MAPQKGVPLVHVTSGIPDDKQPPIQESVSSDKKNTIDFELGNGVDSGDSSNNTPRTDHKNDSDEGNHNNGGTSQKTSERCSNIPWQSIKFVAFYFLTGGAPAMLLPYLSVYYRQLGLDPHQIGVVKSLQPWVAIPAIPIWGFLADKLNVNRLVFMVALVGYLVSNVALAFTPKVEQVDCATAISRICRNPLNLTQRFLSSTKSAAFADVTNKMTTVYEDSVMNDTSFRNSSQRICQPDGQSTGYLYEADDVIRLYVYLIVINVAGEIWQAPTPALGNAAVLNGLGKERRNQYGYYKAAGAVAAAIGLLVVGVAIDYTGETYIHCGLQLSRANYYICFIGFGFCVLFAIPIAWNMNAEKVHGKPRKYYFGKVVKSLCNIRYGSAFLAITWLSIAIGVAKSFDYWYIEFLGGSHSTMGWTGMLGTVFLIITFLGLPHLNERFGHLPFLVLALFVTGCGCGVTAFITNPWWMTLPMCLRGIATATSTQSAGAYLANAVDKDHMTTLQTIMAAIIFGVGNGAGSLLGGTLIKVWSPFVCYMVFAAASFFFSGLLIVVQLI